MTTESVSFRITRTAEDLAHTVSALSHRLVRLEQRLAGLELQADHRVEPGAEELATLDSVERMLIDCRLLLEESAAPAPTPAGGMAYQQMLPEKELEHVEEIEHHSEDHGERAYAA